MPALGVPKLSGVRYECFVIVLYTDWLPIFKYNVPHNNKGMFTLINESFANLFYDKPYVAKLQTAYSAEIFII